MYNETIPRQGPARNPEKRPARLRLFRRSPAWLCLLWLCLACLCRLASPALAAPPTATDAAVSPDGTPQYGDALVLGTIGEPSNLISPLASDTASRAVTGKLYVAPLKFDRDMNVVPWAAEVFEILDDGLKLRFELKKGIFWQDGVELTAEDVEFTYKMMIDPQTPTAYAGDFKVISSFRRTGRYSFEVTYDKPFPRSLSTWMSDIMPRHALEGQDLRTTALARKPLSCGPYLLEDWQAGSQVRLKANPDYFEGKPYLSDWIFQVIPDLTTMFLELRAGKLDVMESLTPLQYLYQTRGEEFQREFGLYRDLANAYTYMGYNLKSPLFSDVRVRQALAHAVNKKEIIKGALLGQGEPTIGPYKPGLWAYNTAIADYPHDPQKALEMLAEAGWKKGPSGRLEKDGRPFSFTLLTNQGNEQRIAAAVFIQSQLEAVGIEVKIRTVEWAAFLKQFVDPGYFDAVILGWQNAYDPDTYDIWHSSRAGKGLNFVSFANAEADKCLEEGRSTFDQAKRKAAYDRLQEILHQEQPYCFLYVPYSLTAVQRRYRGLDPAPAGLFHNADKWWVPQREQRHRISAR